MKHHCQREVKTSVWKTKTKHHLLFLCPNTGFCIIVFLSCLNIVLKSLKTNKPKTVERCQLPPSSSPFQTTHCDREDSQIRVHSFILTQNVPNLAFGGVSLLPMKWVSATGRRKVFGTFCSHLPHLELHVTSYRLAHLLSLCRSLSLEY